MHIQLIQLECSSRQNMIFSISGLYGENNRWDSLVEKNYIDQNKNVRKDSNIRL